MHHRAQTTVDIDLPLVVVAHLLHTLRTHTLHQIDVARAAQHIEVEMGEAIEPDQDLLHEVTRLVERFVPGHQCREPGDTRDRLSVDLGRLLL